MHTGVCRDGAQEPSMECVGVVVLLLGMVMGMETVQTSGQGVSHSPLEHVWTTFAFVLILLHRELSHLFLGYPSFLYAFPSLFSFDLVSPPLLIEEWPNIRSCMERVYLTHMYAVWLKPISCFYQILLEKWYKCPWTLVRCIIWSMNFNLMCNIIRKLLIYSMWSINFF